MPSEISAGKDNSAMSRSITSAGKVSADRQSRDKNEVSSGASSITPPDASDPSWISDMVSISCGYRTAFSGGRTNQTYFDPSINRLDHGLPEIDGQLHVFKSRVNGAASILLADIPVADYKLVGLHQIEIDRNVQAIKETSNRFETRF